MSKTRLRGNNHLGRTHTSRKLGSQSGFRLLASLTNALFWFGMFSAVVFASFYFLTTFSGSPVFRTYVVQSGSMEPSIMTGDIILITPQADYRENDVITFQGSQDRVITHRILDIIGSGDEKSFLTKGDANREADTEIVPLENVLGKVTLMVPKLGYFVTFGKSLYGILLLIVVPAAIVTADELGNIFLALRRKK